MPYSRFFSKCKVVLAALSTLVATVPPLPMQSSAIAPPPLPPDAAYPAPPPADFEQQTKKGDFSIKLAPTVAPIEKVTPIKVVAAEKIDAHRVQEILKRMPPFHEDEKAPAFVLPEQALVRPQIPGTTVEQAFPPSNSAKRPNESVAGPLKILRINQSGQVDNVRELAIVFFAADGAFD